MEVHPSGIVTFADGREVFTTHKPLKDDISAIMKDRVLKGYGIDPKTNTAVLQNDPELKKVWEEIQYAKDNDASVRKVVSSVAAPVQSGVPGGSSPAVGGGSSSDGSGGDSSSGKDGIGGNDSGAQGGMRNISPPVVMREEKGKDPLKQSPIKRVGKPQLQPSQPKPRTSPSIPSSSTRGVDKKSEAMYVGCTALLSIGKKKRVTKSFSSVV